MRHFGILFLLLALGLITGCVPDQFEFVGEIGKPGSGRGDLLSATDMALSPEGDLVIADSGNNRIQVISPNDGSCKMVCGEYGTTGYNLSGISGCGVNSLTGDIWVCDLRGNKIVKFDKRGNPLLKVIEKMKYPIDVATDRRGDVYVIMSKQPAVYKYDGFGKFIETLGGTGKAALIFATGIFIVDDFLYITDYGGRRIVKMDTKGQFIEEFTKKGDYEEIIGPSNIFVNKESNLLVLDLGYVPVVMLTASGKLISKIGSFGNEPGRFLYPRGIVESAPGEICVLDNSRNCVLKFKRVSK